mgnify:FL=1
MAGQQQIKKYNREAILQESSKNLLEQADLYYLKEKFAIKTKYDELKTIHSFMLKETLCTKNCEIKNFLDKKLRVALKQVFSMSQLKKAAEAHNIKCNTLYAYLIGGLKNKTNLIYVWVKILDK